jgi:predicted ester cyclase
MNRKISFLLFGLALAFALMLGACAAQPQAAISDIAPTTEVENASAMEPEVNASTDVADSAVIEERNLEVVRRFYDEFNAGKPEVILEIHPAAIRMHYAGEAEDVETKLLYEDLAALKQGNPDLHAEVKDMFAAGDIVVTELAWISTQTGDYFGIPPTGKTSIHNGIVVRRLENGLIVESWEIWDDLVFLQSIGYLSDWDTIIANGPMGAEPPVEPVAEPTQEPLPTVSLETLLGLWTQSDPDSGGSNWLRFLEDGTWEAKHGPSFEEGVLVASGTFTLDGDKLNFIYVETPQDLPNCAQGETFQLAFSSTTRIRYEVLEGCDLLATDFVRLPLWKYVP